MHKHQQNDSNLVQGAMHLTLARALDQIRLHEQTKSKNSKSAVHEQPHVTSMLQELLEPQQRLHVTVTCTRNLCHAQKSNITAAMVMHESDRVLLPLARCGCYHSAHHGIVCTIWVLQIIQNRPGSADSPATSNKDALWAGANADQVTLHTRRQGDTQAHTMDSCI